MPKVVVGGTFDIIHRGHRVLIEKAGLSGDEVYIGITSDDLVKKMKPDQNIASYEERKKAVIELLEEMGIDNYTIVKIHDACGKNDDFGSAAEMDYSKIIVSPETRPMAEKINDVRKKKGLPELEIVTIPCIMAEDNRPIRSTRIRRGEIDAEGKIIR
jgi:pantetheine-phosphate adenylyltransferase